MNFEYYILCFINIGMICHFQKMQSAYIHIISNGFQGTYTYMFDYMNINNLHLISKKNYSVENISVATVIKGV